MDLAKLRAALEVALAEGKALVAADGDFDTEAYAVVESQIADLEAKIETAEKREEAEAKLAERQAKLDAVPAPVAGPAISDVHDLRSDNPTLGFKSFGDCALQVAAAKVNPSAGKSEELQFLAASSGLEQATGSLGGFLVPTKFQNEIWAATANETRLAPLCRQIDVGGFDSVELPVSAESDRSSTVAGGALAYWLAEGDEITASNPKLKMLRLEPKALAALVYTSNKLLRNASALNSWITTSAADALSWKIDSAIVRGTGAGMPLGIINSGGLISVTKEVGQPATSIVSKNLSKVRSRMLPQSWNRAVWLANPDIQPELQELSIDVGTGGQAVFLPSGSIVGDMSDRLYGKPIIYNEHLSTLGSVGDIICVDMQSILLGTSGTEAATSAEIRFAFLESGFRFSTNVDAQPILDTAITPAQGTNTLSTHVAIAVRA